MKKVWIYSNLFLISNKEKATQFKSWQSIWINISKNDNDARGKSLHPLSIREIKVKPTPRYHFAIGCSPEDGSSKCWWDCGQNWNCLRSLLDKGAGAAARKPAWHLISRSSRVAKWPDDSTPRGGPRRSERTPSAAGTCPWHAQSGHEPVLVNVCYGVSGWDRM